MLGTISSLYDVGEFSKTRLFDLNSSLDAVLIAVGMTAAVTLALTVFALQTKIDLTMYGGTEQTNQ